MDEFLTGTITPGESGSGSDVNEVVFHPLQGSRTGASPPDAVSC